MKNIERKMKNQKGNSSPYFFIFDSMFSVFDQKQSMPGDG